jgi:copper chaperone CopZ
MYKQKSFTGFLILIYILIAVSCSGGGKKTMDTQVVQEASFIEVSIGGMSCTGCEQTIQNNVGKLEGIKSVKASYKTGNAIIEYIKGVTDTTIIRNAITGSGYTVNKFIAHTGEGAEK